MFKDTAFLGDDDSDEDNGDEWDDTDEADENGLDPLANPANALLLYTRAEIGYYAAHQQGLDYYDKLIAQAIDGQKKAREALTEMTHGTERSELKMMVKAAATAMRGHP